MSRCSSANTFGGRGMPSGVRTVARRSAALRRVGLKLRTPSRACSVAFIRLTMRVRSPTRHSRPVRPLGVLFGNRRDARHATMAPFPAQPPQEPALQQLGVEPVGLGPAMLPRDPPYFEGWITCASTPRAFSQRANQEPSRPASKASAIRVIFLPALTASSRQRCSRPRSLSALGSSFFCG